MRRILEVVLLGLSFALIASTGFCEEIEIPLPESHWAYDDLAELAERGLVSGHTPYDFKGRNVFTREQVARLIEGVIDRYETSPNDFKKKDIAVLGRLREEFSSELQRRGETRNAPVSVESESPAVPLSHWMYEVLADMARRGLVEGAGEKDFLGGRIITRSEAAAYVVAIDALYGKSPARFNEDDKKNIGYLNKEFEKETAAVKAAKAGAPAGKKAPAKKKKVGFTSNLYSGVTKGNKSTITDRLTAEKTGGTFQAYFSGNVENAEKEGTDLEIGSGYTFDFTRKLVGFHSDPSNAKQDDFLLAGDINNLEFANGLIVGAVNLKGAYASANVVKDSRASALWGEDASGHEVLAMQILNRQSGKLIFGAGVVTETLESGESLTTMSVNAVKESSSRRLSVEYAKGRADGYGFYAKFQKSFSKDLKTLVEYRNYEDFALEHNNPRIYSGRSGGDETNEKSYYLGVDWRMSRKWVALIARDHAYSPDAGSRTNVFWSVDYQPSKMWQFGLGREKERGAVPSDAENSFRIKYSGFRSIMTSMSWKRSVRSSGPTSTTRLDVSHPLSGKSARMLYSFTRRKSVARRTNSCRFRFTRSLNSAASMSLSYDYSRTAINKFDANLAWKF